MHKRLKYENQRTVWDLIQLIESCLTLASFSTFCIYVLCKVKCSL
jgi:hypothetical protein